MLRRAVSTSAATAARAASSPPNDGLRSITGTNKGMIWTSGIDAPRLKRGATGVAPVASTAYGARLARIRPGRGTRRPAHGEQRAANAPGRDHEQVRPGERPSAVRPGVEGRLHGLRQRPYRSTRAISAARPGTGLRDVAPGDRVQREDDQHDQRRRGIDRLHHVATAAGEPPPTPAARQTTRNGRPREAQRQPPRRPKVATACTRRRPGDQDRPAAASQDHVPQAQ